MNQRPRFDELPPSQQAAILCNDPRFQTFAARRSGYPDDRMEASAAAEYVRQICSIDSRRDLNRSTAANVLFQRLRTEFDQWIGRIAPHR